ncbi:hypothetical protein IAT38_004141 [Cryptococcus sp. DSM 104549]
MVNVSYTLTSSDTVYYTDDGTPALYNNGDIAWIMTCMALVWIMVPGVGLFYSGPLRRKNALSMIFLSIAGVGVASFQWFFWGYSLTFSETGNAFFGNLKSFGLKGVLAEESAGSSRLPALLFCIYQCMFCIITGVLAIGGFAERARVGPIMVFLFCWLTIVYCPIVYWTWNANGWSFVLGGLDFAGGTPVHISSGTAALAISLYLGKRKGYGTAEVAYRPHNASFVALGTVFLWFGWFGFNGGSALSANLRAVQACVVTNLAAAGKWSAVGFCSGAISGLVGITPAAGFVGAPAAVCIGVVAGVACNFSTKLKLLLRVDETLDVFATHGIGGMVGCIFTGIFAQASVAGFDGFTEIPGGWLDHNWVQVGYQIGDMVAGFAWSFGVTTALCWGCTSSRGGS